MPGSAPTLVPTKAGDRVRTDRRDAEKRARCHRSGDLTAVWVPDAAHEALRDLIRAREAAKKDQLRAKHRLSKFLLSHGMYRPWLGGFLLRKQRNLALSEEVKEIAWKAQYRLHKRYLKLTAAGKNKNRTVTAVERELLGSSGILRCAPNSK